MKGIGAKLRAAREARGLSLGDVSAQTRIPEPHLAAIEEDRLDDLPPGPYRSAWLRTYCEIVDVEEPVVMPSPGDPPLVPLNVVRAVGLVTLFAAIGLIAWLQWGPKGGEHTGPAPVAGPDQEVVVAALQNVKLHVEVDGEPAFDGVLSGGESLDFSAHDRIEIDVPSVESVKLHFNGERIVPQGRQDAPRRIVFVDDGAP
ncbi:MAG: helix-turn-helix domain-containing protein [Alphaproteobacteria bacterium]|nr:helix-turn-helix domain-containing protein [Alphaproteobacteria bacterium]